MRVNSEAVAGPGKTCLFTRLEGVKSGFSRVSDSPVSAENVTYEAFFLAVQRSSRTIVFGLFVGRLVCPLMFETFRVSNGN